MNFIRKYKIILILILLLLVISLVLFYPYFYERYIRKNNLPSSLNLDNSKQQDKDNPNVLQIPTLGISAPINYLDQPDESLFQQSLQTGVVHYPGSANLGQEGNVYIFGHSSDYPFTKGEYKTVFAKLPDIKLGSSIFLTDKDGKKYEYLVASTKVVASNDVSVLSQDTKGQRMLTLQTSYPVGTALKRFVVICYLRI